MVQLSFNDHVSIKSIGVPMKTAIGLYGHFNCVKTKSILCNSSRVALRFVLLELQMNKYGYVLKKFFVIPMNLTLTYTKNVVQRTCPCSMLLTAYVSPVSSYHKFSIAKGIVKVMRYLT